MGRAVYEQTCQVCHGPELKGDRGPEIDTVVSRLGADATRNVITNGRAGMPAFSSLPAQSMNELMAFLTQPDLAPLGSAPSAAMQALVRSYSEPPYPEDVEAPPSRYKTGYGNERYVIHTALEHHHRLRSEYRQDQMADSLWRPSASRPKRQDAGKCVSEERVCDHSRRTGVVCRQRLKTLRVE